MKTVSVPLAHSSDARGSTLLPLPANFLELMGRRRLVFLALEAVQMLKPPRTSGADARNGDRGSDSVMMTLLNYCYATGVYGSREIAGGLRRDRVLRYIACGQRPDWEAIRQFRRRNVHSLEQSLFNLFHLACQTSLPAGPATGIPESIERQLRLEAKERIRRAMQFDSMAMDE